MIHVAGYGWRIDQTETPPGVGDLEAWAEDGAMNLDFYPNTAAAGPRCGLIAYNLEVSQDLGSYQRTWTTEVSTTPLVVGYFPGDYSGHTVPLGVVGSFEAVAALGLYPHPAASGTIRYQTTGLLPADVDETTDCVFAVNTNPIFSLGDTPALSDIAATTAVWKIGADAGGGLNYVEAASFSGQHQIRVKVDGSAYWQPGIGSLVSLSGVVVEWIHAPDAAF